jgi:DNA-binding PadR family transcriptional regulator
MAARSGRRDAERASGIKPMTSQVNWAVLGLLIERPGYGYQIMQRFADTYGEELPLRSDSHVYSALNALESRGLIEELPGASVVLSGTDRQPRPSYRATHEGVLKYRDWMLAQTGEDRRRCRLFVRQLAVFAHEPEAALEVLDRYEQECLREAANTRAIASNDLQANTVGGLVGRLISEESRLVAQARLPWVEYAREAFRSLMENSDEPA